MTALQQLNKREELGVTREVPRLIDLPEFLQPFFVKIRKHYTYFKIKADHIVQNNIHTVVIEYKLADFFLLNKKSEETGKRIFLSAILQALPDTDIKIIGFQLFGPLQLIKIQFKTR